MNNIIQQLNKQSELAEMYNDNYSYYQTYHYLIKEREKSQLLSNQQVSGMIEEVSKLFLKSHFKVSETGKKIHEIGYSMEVFDLIVFLLCYLDVPHAWFMLETLYVNFIPKYAHPRVIAENAGKVI